MVKLLLRSKKTFSHAVSTPREAGAPSVNPISRRANHLASLGARSWLVQPLSKKYFCFTEIKMLLYDLHPVPERGALAIVTNVGAGSGGRGSARALE